jgi:hypothetical protein
MPGTLLNLSVCPPIVHVFAVRMVQEMVVHTDSPAVVVVIQITCELGPHDTQKKTLTQ